MPRTLYTLEGQQLRMLRDRAQSIVERAPDKRQCLPEAAEIVNLLDKILAYGPTIEDEED